VVPTSTYVGWLPGAQSKLYGSSLCNVSASLEPPSEMEGACRGKREGRRCLGLFPTTHIGVRLHHVEGCFSPNTALWVLPSFNSHLSDVFEVDPVQMRVPSRSHAFATVTFTPQKVQNYRCTFNASVDVQAR